MLYHHELCDGEYTSYVRSTAARRDPARVFRSVGFSCAQKRLPTKVIFHYVKMAKNLRSTFWSTRHATHKTTNHETAKAVTYGPNGTKRTGWKGRFAPGNKAAVGNPLGPLVQRLRAELLRLTTAADVALWLATLRGILKKGRDADRLGAIRFWKEAVLGEPEAIDVMDQLEKLRQQVEQRPKDEPGNDNMLT